MSKTKLAIFCKDCKHWLPDDVDATFEMSLAGLCMKYETATGYGFTCEKPQAKEVQT